MSTSHESPSYVPVRTHSKKPFVAPRAEQHQRVAELTFVSSVDGILCSPSDMVSADGTGCPLP